VTENELLADIIQRTKVLLINTLKDFTDSDMLHRPCPTANHAAWQLGHVTESLRAQIRQFKPTAAPMPERRFTKGTASSNDPAMFGTKAAMLSEYESAMDEGANVVRQCSVEDFAKPTAGPFANFAPTLGHVAAIIASHSTMHVGQFQVIRRMLGKPVLF
jgi:hypothetical protein